MINIPSKENKQKVLNPEAILLFCNNSNLVFFVYKQNHPKFLNSEQFILGQIKLFYKQKIYSSPLKSKLNLNPSLEWNQKSFQVMLERFKDFSIQQQHKDDEKQIYLNVTFILKNKEISLVRVKMDEQFANNPPKQLWNEFQKYNNSKIKHFSNKKIQIQNMQHRVNTQITRLQQVQIIQKQKVGKIKGQLSVLLHQKETKLMELTANKRRFSYGKTGNNNQLKMETVQWVSSQDDKMLVGSLFAPSQDFLI